MGWKIGSLCLLMTLALIGCNNLGEAQEAQVEAIPSVTLPPSDTPIPSPTRPTATLPPAHTLPPTWTPAPIRTAVVRENTPTPLPTASPTPVLIPDSGCDQFAPALERNSRYETILEGETAVIYWSGVPGYQYRVQLYHPAGMITVSEIVDNERYAFRGEQLNSPGYTFGWEVQLVDSRGTLVCSPISGEITVEPYFE